MTMQRLVDRPRHRAATPSVPASARTVDASLPALLCVTTVLIYLPVVLAVVTIAGVAEALPPPLRASVAVLVAVTLPGVPVAALLRLPFNGIFASVAIAVSLATTVLLSQFSVVTGLRDPGVQQMLVVAVSVVLTVRLVRRYLDTEPTTTPGYLAGLVVALRHAAKTSIAMLAVAVILFGTAVGRLDVTGSGAHGLIAVLPVSYFVGLGLLCVVFVAEFRRIEIARPVIAAATVILMVYLTMPVAWSNGLPPFPTAYVHQYIADWIDRLGELPPPVDARISWSGFFAAAAHVADVAALSDTRILLTSASLFFGVLLMFPVYALGRALTGSDRLAWLGVMVFVVVNWYQQDYFAPQALAMQLYVTIMAVLVWQVHAAGPGPPRRSGRWWTIPNRPPGRDAWWMLAVEGVLVVLIAAMVVSHQLTPLVLIGSLVALSILGATRHKLLWVMALLLFVAWFTFGADAYWRGHLGELLNDLGAIGSSLNAGVSDRVAGDPTYGRMQLLRVAAALLLSGLAVVGWLRLRGTRCAGSAAALAVVPFLLVAVQSYGGEVVIRCFLYATPVLAPLAAVALDVVFRSRSGLARAVSAAGAVAVLFTLAAWGVTNRGLNIAFERTTAEEVQVSERLVDQVPGEVMYWGQGLLLGLPRGHDIGADCLADQRDLAECTAGEDGDYFILTTQDVNYLHYRYRVDPDAALAAVNSLAAHHGFQRIYTGPDVQVLKRQSAPQLRLEEP